jgi:sugar phosphate permease
MRYKPFFIACAALLILGLGFLVSGFNGDMNVTFGSSLQSNVFRLCGSTTGWRVVAGVFSILAGIGMLVVALVVVAKDKART